MFFQNRTEAGKKLAQKIKRLFPELEKNKNAIVLALPRGGIPIAFEIADALKAPMDLIFTHKLRAPDNEELAIGAVAEDGSSFIDPDFSDWACPEPCRRADRKYLRQEIRYQLNEIQNRIAKYRLGRKLPDIKDKIAILVDDGIATGSTMISAVRMAKNSKALKIIVAAPVLPDDTLYKIGKEADKVVYLDAPAYFGAISRFYAEFPQLRDEEVMSYMGELVP